MSTERTFQAIWLFDSVCVLCDGGVQYTLRHEKAPTIQFVSIQSERGRALAQEHNIDPDDPDTFLFIEGDVAHQKSDGVIALSKHLNGIVRIASIGPFIPKFLRDFAYELVARNRYRIFGKKEHCIIPDVENRHRFVL